MMSRFLIAQMAYAVSVLPFTAESEVAMVWLDKVMGDHLGPGYNPVLILELGTQVSRGVVVVGLCCASRVFLQFSGFLPSLKPTLRSKLCSVVKYGLFGGSLWHL